MSTIGALIDRLYREWLTPADQTPTLALLDADVDASTTSIVLDTSTMSPDEQNAVGPGTVIEIGLEQILVRSFAPGSKTVTGLRGYAGTTAAAHTADDLVFVSPPFSRASAFDAIADEVVSLHPPLWGFKTDAVVSQEAPIEVDADVVGLASVQFEDSTGHVQNGTGLLVRNYPPAASGRAVNLRGVPIGETAYLTMKTEFTRPTSEDDTLSDLMIEEQWSQILVVGAASRMSTYVDPSRLNFDWVTEFDQTQVNPVGTAAILGRRLMAMRDDLVNAAARRLRQEYPSVTTWSDPFDPMQRV